MFYMKDASGNPFNAPAMTEQDQRCYVRSDQRRMMVQVDLTSLHLPLGAVDSREMKQ